MVLPGILLGLGAALLQSVAHFCSRLYVIRREGGVWRLLVLGHVLMGIGAGAVLPLAWTGQVPPVRAYAWPLAGTAGFYIAGQLGLFMVLRRTDTSRVSALLGLKLAILAGITVGPLSGTLTGGQWLAVALTLGAAWLLHGAGLRIPRSAMAWVLYTCLMYSLSDLSIVWMVERMAPVSRVRAAMVGSCLCYLLLGGVAVALLPAVRRRRRADWLLAVPFAASWLTGMFCLFGCFALVGVVLGNILQSTRGVVSVVIGAAVSAMGAHDMERREGRAVWMRRAVAAGLMTAAVVLYTR
jgi:drug/metabolite transporter (DMT)-like permease